MKKVNFEGQKIYNGIDVHQKQWNVSIYTKDSYHKTFQQPPDSEVLKNYLDKHFPGGIYYSVYEAGNSGFSPHRHLEGVGIQNIVVHPGDVPTTDKERKQKRDARDSRKLGRSLRNGDLEAIHIPSLALQQDREIVRYRCNKILPKLTRVKNQIKSYVSLYGHRYWAEFGSGSYWSKKFVAWLEQLNFTHASGRQALDLLLEELKWLQGQLKRTDRLIVELSRQDRYRDQVVLLRSVPGVGLLVAMVILTEIGQMSRFSSLDHLCHYVGLVPNVYASDDKERVGRQTRRGNSLMRRMLLQSAWHAIRLDPALLQKYEQLTQRMNGNKAIIRIEKKLLNRIRRVLLSGIPYELGVLR